MIALLAGIVGIISTILAWNLNPKRKLYAELDFIFKELDMLYKKRDDALAANNSDALTVALDMLIRVHNRKAILLQRLG